MRETPSVQGDELLAGTPYRFVRVLGEGGMGLVVEAEHIALGTPVALKVIGARWTHHPELGDRFRMEAQLLARLHHPNLVLVTDLGRTGAGRPYFAMERLDGRTLRAELTARRTIPWPEAVQIAREALAGLGAAHSIGLVHRDIKPENLFLTQALDGRRTLKVLDFGVAKVLAEAAAAPDAPAPPAWRTSTGVLMGTPAYLAPEQITGGAVSPVTDLYAIGLVLFEMLTGSRAFPIKDPAELLQAHLSTMPPAPSRVAAQPIPPALDALVLRAVAKAPVDRFRAAREMEDALAALAGDASVPPSFAPPAAPGPAPTQRATVRAAPPAAAAPISSTHVAATVAATDDVATRLAPAKQRAASRAGSADRRARVLGAVCITIAGCDVLLRIYQVVDAIGPLLDPDAAAAEMAESVAKEHLGTARELLLRVAPVELVRHLLLGATTFALVLISIALIGSGASALPAVRRWGGWAAVVLVVTTLADLTLVMPAHFAYHDLFAGGDESRAIASRVVTTMLAILALVIPAFQIAGALFVRWLAGRWSCVDSSGRS